MYKCWVVKLCDPDSEICNPVLAKSHIVLAMGLWEAHDYVSDL